MIDLWGEDTAIIVLFCDVCSVFDECVKTPFGVGYIMCLTVATFTSQGERRHTPPVGPRSVTRVPINASREYQNDETCFVVTHYIIILNGIDNKTLNILF